MLSTRDCCVLVILSGVSCAGMSQLSLAQTLPPVPVPSENPITESKRILGKMLFWDEQLSTDNSTSCGTCHQMSVAGTDPRFAVHPGLDEVFNTEDDVFGSPGVVHSNESNEYSIHELFGLDPQVTARAANSSLLAMYPHDLFWDGRATNEFFDPVTGDLVIADKGALESQAIGPVLNNVEMAHVGRDWELVSVKLDHVRPMALAEELTDDMVAVLANGPSYNDLFDVAFGSPEITPVRIAMAIATYERTLVPDQTPWDAFIEGNQNALTPGQRAGWNFFQNSVCMSCHTAPLFTDLSFRNIGVRPLEEDQGRFDVTGNPEHRGRFKVPSLRNVGLKSTFLHNGMLTSVGQVLDFYVEVNGQVQFPENQDPIMNIVNIPPQVRPALEDFLENGLTDPRVANATFPFDQPSLHPETMPNNPRLIGGGVPDDNGQPLILVQSPPNLGNDAFRCGLTDASPGSEAYLIVSRSNDLENGRLAEAWRTHGPYTVAEDGSATWLWAIPDQAQFIDDTFFAQWWVGDEAASPVARFRVFCHRDCPCLGDLDGDDVIGVNDLLALIAAWGPSDEGDLNDDDVTDVADLLELLGQWGNCD